MEVNRKLGKWERWWLMKLATANMQDGIFVHMAAGLSKGSPNKIDKHGYEKVTSWPL